MSLPEGLITGRTVRFPCDLKQRPKVKVPQTDLADTFIDLWNKYGSGIRPEREFQFDADRKWRFDVAWDEYKVAVELEGGLWVKSRHRTGKGYQADIEKYNAAVNRMWRVLRFSADDLRKRPFQCIEEVAAQLKSKGLSDDRRVLS